MNFPNSYKLFFQPSTNQWVLKDGRSKITSWTMFNSPSQMAVLKAIKLWEEHCEHCIDNWYDPLPFKTFHS